MVKIDFKNTGKEPHDLQFIRVKDGTTPEQFTKEVLGSDEGAPIPDYVLSGGGSGAIAPGTSNTVTQKFEAGSYIYFCQIDGEAGPHYDNGMRGSTKVQGDKGKGDLPKTDASIKAKDYGFDITGLKAGSNTVTFENTGQELHHAQFFPLAAGATFDEAKASFLSDAAPTGPPPVNFEKGTGIAVASAGAKLVQTNFNLEKGTYVVLCFISDRAGGPPHLTKGMIQKLDVP